MLVFPQRLEGVRSPAAALMATKLFKGWNIPIVGHTAEVQGLESELVAEGRKHTATITAYPPGITREVWMTTWAGTPQTDKQRHVVLEYPDERGRIVGRQFCARWA